VTRLEWTRGKALSGRYVMVRQLGEGGMGTVYLADDLLLRRRVAVKTLWQDGAFDPNDIERFRREVALAHVVNHPNIARTYDLGEANGVQFITMEHLEGETLMARVRRGPPLTSDEVRQLAVPVCRGLAAAHRKGVVHRDLKPANIMLVNDERRAVILDFGIARDGGDAGHSATPAMDGGQLASTWGVTSAGLGTPAYMAPEQWAEQSGDARTDLYALGVILYICLTGKAPYAGDTVEEMAQLHRTAPVPDPVEAVPGMDPDLAKLVRDCMAKRPDDRPASVDEVLWRLERHSLQRRYALRLVAWSALAWLALAGVGESLLAVAEHAVLREMRPSLKHLAMVIAAEIDGDDLAAVNTKADLDSPAFRRVHATLRKWKGEYPDIGQLYTMRAVDDRGHFVDVVDLYPQDVDRDGDGQIGPDEKGQLPGEPYDGSAMPAMMATAREHQPQADADFNSDVFGFTLSGYAPIHRSQQPTSYLVGVDVPNRQLLTLAQRVRATWFSAWLVSTAIMAFLWHPRRMRRQAASDVAQALAAEP
jgi:serine/threonine-protein kinase